MLSVLSNLPFIGPIINNLKMLAICAAVVIVTNAGTGLVSYIKGYNSAALQCKIGSVKRERDEMQRDRDNAIASSDFLKKKLQELQDKQDDRDAKDRETSAGLKPIDGCVVPSLPRTPPHRVRNNRSR